MISGLGRYVGPLGLFLALAISASLAPAQPTDPSANTPLKLRLKGMAPDAVLADATALRATLLDYKVPEPPDGNFRTWIRNIRQARNGLGSEVIGGVGGIPGRTLLWLAEGSTTPAGGFGAPSEATVSGQIEAECEAQPGYVRNADGSGRLCVTVFTTKARGASGQTQTRADRFLVFVDPGGFEVEPRDRDNPTTAFPDFTEASGMAIPQGMAKDFNHKLWASGTSIHVVKLWRAENYDPTSPGSAVFHPVNLNAQEYRSLKAPNQDACIDMMFLGMPPMTYAGLQGPPFYCLGRCAEPPLINTK